MERWQLVLLLSAAAAVGALVAPSLSARVAPVEPPPKPEQLIPEATQGSSLRLDARLDRSAVLAGDDGLRYLVVSVTAPDSTQERVPVDVTLVIDTSCSMGQEGKIDQARAAAAELVDALRPGDRFALVAFDDRARVLAEGAAFDGDGGRLRRIVQGLREDGGTNLWDGLEAGRAQLGGAHPARKVLVVSDGNANVGETEPAAFARLARGYGADGASVSAIGLGRDFNETLLEGMADAGGGTYRFVGEPEELPAVIAAELARTTETIARRARVRVSAAPGVQLRQVYGWGATLTPDGAEVEVGDMAAGQTRKIVVAVRIPTDERGERPVATAELVYAGVDGSDGQARARVHALVTASAQAVEASVDEAASVAATSARAGELTRASAELWRRGETVQALQLVQSASEVIAEARATRDAPELRAAAARMVELRTLGDAEGSSYAAKAASEAGRDLAR